MSDVKIQWHPGFAAAMALELAENRANLVYEKEYNLNTRPLEIDLLVIKKERDVEIKNSTGKIFRRYNILEYKSPEDSFNIDTFYKSGAYASLYKAYGETVDERKAQDITVSVVREARPAGLFSYFRKHGIRIEKAYQGIYYVMDSVLFPTQIIVSKELDRKNHIWLKALSARMEKRDMRELLNRVEGMKYEYDRELADSVLEVSIRANRHMVEELRGDDSMCQALLEIMEPEINKMKAEAAAEAAAKAAAEAAAEAAAKAAAAVTAAKENEILCAVKSFRDLGASDIQIMDVLMKNHRLSSAEAEKYL